MSTVSDPAVAGQNTDPSAVTEPLAVEMEEAMDRVGDVLDSKSLSQLAVRADGRLMVSLEDADERDLTGREVVSFMLLTRAEAGVVRERATNLLSEVAARTVAELPRAVKP